MGKDNKVVYLHRKETNGEIFYVGIGTPKRPYSFIGRNSLWQHIQRKYGCTVEVIQKGLTVEEACDMEIMLIEKYGRISNNSGILSNISPGGEKGPTDAVPLVFVDWETGEIISRRTPKEYNKTFDRTPTTCPHCGLVGKGPSSMGRHFDKCKHKIA